MTVKQRSTRTPEKKPSGRGGPKRKAAGPYLPPRELAAEEQELRALARRLLGAQDDERRRVARELHDSLSQRLALLQIRLETLRQSIPISLEGVHRQLHAALDQVATLAVDVRRIAHGLHPPILDYLGLPEALQNLCDEAEDHRTIRVKFRHRGVPASIPPAVGGCFYQIAQEALRNIVKHAGHTEVWVFLSGSAEGQLGLFVRDLGKGFNATAGKLRGLGILSMRERAALMHGEFKITSQPGRGTLIKVRIPPHEASSERTLKAPAGH